MDNRCLSGFYIGNEYQNVDGWKGLSNDGNELRTAYNTDPNLGGVLCCPKGNISLTLENLWPCLLGMGGNT